MKKIFYILGLVLAMASCTDDNADWLQPQKGVPGESDLTLVAAEAAAVELAGVTDETVQLFVPVVNADATSKVSYKVDLFNTDKTASVELVADKEGKVNVAELKDAISALFGKRPVARQIPLEITTVIIDGQALKTSVEGIVTVTPDPSDVPVIEDVYYLTGTMNGWNNSNTDFALQNGGGDVYDDPVFTCVVPATSDGSDIEFKVTPLSGVGGDWSKCLTASDTEGKFATDNAGGNFKIVADADAVSYLVTFDMLDQTYTVTVQKSDQFIYFIGATDGWTSADQKLESPTCNKIYTGYVYVADPNGWGLEFKFQKVQNSWDDQVNSNNLVTITGDFEKGSDNIKASAGEGVYYVLLDLNNNVMEATKINNMNLVGQFNGWNAQDNTQQMTWNATDYCFEFTGATVTADGWKFTANDNWTINLGGDTPDELVGNGNNLSAVGTTIKLYPTRKTSDKIYCTVE